LPVFLRHGVHVVSPALLTVYDHKCQYHATKYPQTENSIVNGNISLKL